MVGDLHRAGKNAGFHSLPLPAHADGLHERHLDDVLAEQRRDWIAGKRIPADETLRQHPELAAEPASAAEVFYHEFSLRQELGESPDWQQQLRQYPEHATLLERLREADQLVEATLAAPEPWPADTFADYELLGEVGRGGMGVVFRARHKRLDRIVALKLLRSDGAGGERIRFDREAHAVARLKHPNIVQVYEVGETAGQAFIALEFVDGQSLARRLHGTPRPARQAAALVEILARAMHYAHEKGVIHRDLKPSNIMMRLADGTDDPVIVDFGLARCVEPGSARLTASGLFIGTWQYMTPQQLCGEPDALGAGCDIYALGVIMYELLTGRLPFDAPGQVVRGNPAPPSSCRALVDPLLEAICLKAMAASSAARYASMRDLASDLTDYLRSTAATAGAGDSVPNSMDKAATFQAPSAPGPLSAGKDALLQTATLVPGAPADGTLVQRLRKATRVAIDRSPPPARPRVWSNQWVVTGIACALITIAIGFWAGGVLRLRTAVRMLGKSPTPASLAAIRDAGIDRGQSVRASADPADLAEIVGEVAPGFTAIPPVRPGGVAIVAEHFGRRRVLATHPLDPVHACILTSTINVPALEETSLTFDVSHSAVGDWQLIVLANGERLYDAPVGPTTTRNGWLAVSVDLTRFAGKQVALELQNKATGYSHEWGYWDKVKITSRGAEESHRLFPSPLDAAHVRPQPLNCTGSNGVSPDVVRWVQEAWAQYLGRDVEENIEIANGVTMTFVLVPPGTFFMGSPLGEKGKNGRYPNETLHVVTLTEPFDLGKYEVTQAQYAALTRTRPSYYNDSDRPVEQVTWDEADAFGRGLTKKLSDRNVYRLPTEAEWEYSCRGGRPSSEPFGIGDGRSLTSRDANFKNTLRQTSKVGSYAANALGLCDMHGNVWEWCADSIEPYSVEAVSNHLRLVGGSFRVARGGSHNEPAAECRSAIRQGSPVERRDCWVGFRLARSVPSAGTAVVAPRN
jgi:formylglycine-generating enzyme required for sulfatase activity/predicted Ser/Thr protein kinase